MKTWPKHPVIYEINTWVWLCELSRKYQRSVNLATVPEEEWDAIASYGFDAVWFMGVWDNVGSPYCVRRKVSSIREAVLFMFMRPLREWNVQ